MHAVFCCVGALAITGSLHHIDRDLLGWWLCERQCKDGGLNGRPEKLADVRFTLLLVMYALPSIHVATMDLIEPLQILKVCYSWWVLSSLVMIDRVHWIDKEKLTKFILNCQVTVY